VQFHVKLRKFLVNFVLGHIDAEVGQGAAPYVIAYAFARFENLLVRAINQRSSETPTSRRRLEEIEREIRNRPQAIASMGLSPFLRAQLQELEAEHDDLKARLASLEPLTLDRD
jgi:flagellar motility protein MotE (MotC chaperone)